MNENQKERLLSISIELRLLVDELAPIVHCVPPDTQLAYAVACMVCALRALEECQ